jgi:hypothetical protein
MSAHAAGESRVVEEPSLATELLRVDYDSERLRVGTGLIGEAWQIPLELARRATRAGARSIAVRFDGSRLFVLDDGRGVKREVLSALAALLDPVTQAEARHLALVRIEQAGELGFLALSAAGMRRVRIQAPGGETAIELVWKRGERPCIMERPVGDGRTVVEIDASWDRSDVRSALNERCRFAEAAITVDGCAAPKGFRDAYAAIVLGAPLAGALALVPRSPARVFLLLDGVIAAHTTLTEGPSCEAAVEMRPWIGERSSPAALREAFQEHEATLLKHAKELVLERARSIQAASEPERRLIRRELLILARQSVIPREALTAPILRALAPNGERWLSLLDLGREAGMIEAIFPDQNRDRFILTGAPVLVLDAHERALLGELLDVGFRPPPERPRDTKRLARRVRETLRAVRDGVGALIGARVLADSALAHRDREALRRLRTELQDSFRDVRMCKGRGHAKRSGGALLVPRGNALWRAGRIAVMRDPAWVYPLIVALLEGRAAPAAPSASRWRERSSGRRAAGRAEQY